MNRRTVLQWLSFAIGSACAAIVAVPGLFYIIDPLRRRNASKGVSQRIARLEDLTSGVPKRFAVSGRRRDAWTLYDRETLGRVWLVRRSGETTPPAQCQVDAFTAVCPHLGCAVELDASQKQFICPCHQAAFNLSGDALSSSELGRRNPTPRGMDSLQCSVVQDATTGQWWVETTFEKFKYGLTEKVARG